MDKKESIIRQIWLVLAVITFLSGIGLVKLETDAVCRTFFASNDSVEIRTCNITASSLYVAEFNRKNQDTLEKESVVKPYYKHIQMRFFSLDRFFILLAVILLLLIATVMLLYSDTRIAAIMAGLGIVLCIHKKDGSK